MKGSVACLASALLLACAHSPEPTFFALAPQSGAVVSNVRALKIELRRTGLPGYLDRPHIVRRASAERLELDADERWGAPLDEMVGATLAEDLAQRLPNSVVYTDTGPISAAPDLRVEVQLFRFERVASGEVQLLAEVAVHSAGTATPLTQRVELAGTPSRGNTAALVSALSHLLGQLSDRIAAMIQQQPATSQLQASPATE